MTMNSTEMADLFTVLYARCFTPALADADRFAALAESGYIGATRTPHGQFAGYEIRLAGWKNIVDYMGYEQR